MPADPGTYEVRYHVGSDNSVLARTSLTVTAASASLSATESARPGGTVSVTWTGPGHDADYVAIGRPGDSADLTYEYVNRGNPVEVPVPAESGAYELRYVLGQGNIVIARLPLTVRGK